METKTKSRQKKSQEETSVQDVIVIQRVFNLPVEVVWLALTDPAYFKKWWGPKDFTVPSSQMDATVGGKYLNCMRSPEGKDYWSTGEVKELVKNKKLVVSDSFSDENGNIKTAGDYGMPGDWPRELQITFELEEADGATKLKLVHEGVPPEMHDDCMQGWNESFDKLEDNIK